jgi:hypothetical protein
LKLHSDWGLERQPLADSAARRRRTDPDDNPERPTRNPPNAERLRGTDLEAPQRVLDCVARRLVIARCPFRVEETRGHQLLREFSRRSRTLLAEVRQPRLEVGERDFIVDCLLDLHARS